MAVFSNEMETDMMELYFNNTNHANIGDATGLQASSTAGSFYVSLHTSDPGDTGNQTTNEANYTSYARVAVARSGAGWTVSGNNTSNTSATQFPACTGGSSSCTHVGIGTDSTGNGHLLFAGALDSTLAVSSGVQPEFASGELDIDLD